MPVVAGKGGGEDVWPLLMEGATALGAGQVPLSWNSSMKGRRPQIQTIWIYPKKLDGVTSLM